MSELLFYFDESTDELENDPDDTPIKSVKVILKISLQQAKTGERIPLAQILDGIAF